MEIILTRCLLRLVEQSGDNLRGIRALDHLCIDGSPVPFG